MKFKKGDLTEHVSDIIIAVICIALLIGVAVLVYNSYISDEYKASQKMLKMIETKINAIDSGESTRFSLQSPCKDPAKCEWFIVAWGKEEAGRPDKCYFNSCVCACPAGETKMKKTERAEICQKEGICEFFDFKSITLSINEAYVYEGAELRGQFAGATIARKQQEIDQNSADFRYIPILSPLIELEINKGENYLEINQVA